MINDKLMRNENCKMFNASPRLTVVKYSKSATNPQLRFTSVCYHQGRSRDNQKIVYPYQEKIQLKLPCRRWNLLILPKVEPY